MPSTRRPSSHRARCRIVECDKFAQTRGLCKAHGGGSRCRQPECSKLAQSRGLCIAHGGGRRCHAPDCVKLAQSKGFCIAHGGGRRCAVIGCGKFAQVRGQCKAHSRTMTKVTDNSDAETDTSSVASSPTSVTRSPIYSKAPSKFSIDFLVHPSEPQESAPKQDYNIKEEEGARTLQSLSGFAYAPRPTNMFGGLCRDYATGAPQLPRLSLLPPRAVSAPSNQYNYNYAPQHHTLPSLSAQRPTSIYFTR